MRIKKYCFFFLVVFLVFSFGSCDKKTIGYGVLLWAVEDPEIPSGSVLPVQVRSNIEQAWITGLPDDYAGEEKQIVMVPLPHLEFFNTKGSAEKFAAAFSEYALLYAETVQDGLPIRDKPENNARRTYRLKEGEIIKILEKAEGVEAISTTGSALEGDWYRVLTRSGSIGFCFSYRLRIFEHITGSLGDEPVKIDTSEDRDLEIVLSRIWYPEAYKTMINSGRLNLDFLSKNYSFKAGVLDGKARVFLENDSEEFAYKKITKTGDRSWNFNGTPLNVTLRSDSMLEVQWEDKDNNRKSETFVTLPVSVENIVNQEKERRQNIYRTLYVRGPSFSSANYGTIIFRENGDFVWDDIETLPRGLFSGSVVGSGIVDMDYGLSREMGEQYTGAMALRFNSVSGNRSTLVFAYILDNQGLRMEHIPSGNVSGRTVTRRGSSPFIIYFSADN